VIMQVIPLSAAQESIWLERALRPGAANASYFAVGLKGAVSAQAIRAACLAITSRHPALRGTVAREPVPGVILHPPAEIFQFVVQPLPCEVGQEQQTVRAWQAEHPWPWDLTAVPPIGFTLLTHGADRRTLVIHVHHFGFDGRSKFVFAREFTELLRDARNGWPVVAGRPGCSGVRGGAGRAGLPATDDEVDSVVTYWLDHGVDRIGAPALPLPGEPGTGTGMGTTGRLDLAAAECALLKGLCERQGVSFFAGLMSCLGAQLWAYGNDRAVLAISADTSTAASREQISLQVNKVPCLIPLGAGPTPADLLRRSGEALQHVQRFRRVPFHWVLRRLRQRTGVDVGAGAFSSLSISYLRPEADFGQIPGLSLAWDFFTPNSGQYFDLVFQFRRGQEGVYGRLDYARRLYDAPAAERIMADFAASLGELTANPERRLAGRAAARPSPSLTCPVVRTRAQAVCSVGATRITRSMIAAAADSLRASRPDPAEPMTVAASRSVPSVLTLLAALSAGIPVRLASRPALTSRGSAGDAAIHLWLTQQWISSQVRAAGDLHASLGHPRRILNLHAPCSEAFAGALVRGLATGCLVEVPGADDLADPVTPGGHDYAVDAPFVLLRHLAAAIQQHVGRLSIVLPMTQFQPAEALRFLACRHRVALCLSDVQSGLLGWSMYRARRRGSPWAPAPVLAHRASDVAVTLNGRCVPEDVPGLLSVAVRDVHGVAAPAWRTTPYRVQPRPDGTLRYLGRVRADAGVSLERLGAPGHDELEWLVAAADGVIEAALAARSGPGGLDVALVTAESSRAGVSPPADEERRWRRILRRTWPSGSPLPQRILLVPALPRNCHDDVDREAVSKLFVAAAARP
jgi:hypothetical protein